MDVSVVIPTYNEAANIVPLIDAVADQLDGYNHEMLIVDDGSPDGTADIVSDLRSRYDRLSLLEREGKQGLGSAYQEAFGRVDGDVVVQMDADFSHDPAYLPTLIDPVRAGEADVTVGSRYVDGGDRNDPFHRRIFPLIGSHLYRVMLRSPVRDVTSGFKAYDAAVLDDIDISALPDGFHFQAASLFAAIDAGANVTEIPIDFRPRRAGDPKYSTRDLLDNVRLLCALTVRRRMGGASR